MSLLAMNSLYEEKGNELRLAWLISLLFMSIVICFVWGDFVFLSYSNSLILATIIKVIISCIASRTSFPPTQPVITIMT